MRRSVLDVADDMDEVESKMRNKIVVRALVSMCAGEIGKSCLRVDHVSLSDPC